MHIYQIQKIKQKWFKRNVIDTLMYNIISILFPLIEQNGAEIKKNYLASIFAATKYLADKNVNDSHLIFPKMPEYRQKFGITAYA